MFRLKSMMYYALPLSLLSAALPVQAEIVSTGEDLDNAYLYINQLRQETDMTALSKNSLLQQSAANHAEYLILNDTSGHPETEGLVGFTGVSVGDRVLKVGYLSDTVSENISGGDDNYKSSIDGLMSAIYHRFAFLDFGITDIGVGISRESLLEAGNTSYVYNMGNVGFHQLCQGVSDTTAQSYINSCPNDAEFAVSQEVYEATRDEPMGLNPNIVLWPANNSTDIPPIFYEETPDPLPDFSISGYPVSIQFNPLTYQNVVVSNFTIYRDKDSAPLRFTRELNAATDPNAKFSGLEYALFPLQRLEWNTRYRAELTYSAQLFSGTRETKSLAWEFNTRQFSLSSYSVGQDEQISVPSGSQFTVYFPPTGSSTETSRISWSYSYGMEVGVDIIDSSTTQITVSGQDTDTAAFTFTDGRRFVVAIDNSAQLVNNVLADTGDGVPSAGLNSTTNTDDSTTGETTDKDDSTTDETVVGETTGTIVECDDLSCSYTLNVGQEGFYVMNIELPEGGTEGFWGVSVNTTAGSNPYGFNAGAILKENGDTPGFVGFNLGGSEAVTLTPFEYLKVAEDVLVRIKSKDIVLYSNIVKSGTPVTTDVLDAGFYVAEILSLEGTARGLSGLSLSANKFVDGVNVGGWIDRETSGTSAGFGAFYVASPQQVNVKLFFGETYGSAGSTKLEASLSFQEEDGSRTLKWSSKTN